MNSVGLKILMVAPQPFFSARGTPFSVLHRVRALVSRGHSVDLVTYPLGEDIDLAGLRIVRSRALPFIKKIKVGPSLAKLLLDFPLYFKTRELLSTGRYDLIHSHEEAAFFCASLATKHGLIHIYDMHSSLPQQLSNFKAYNLAFLRHLFKRLEDYVLRSSDGVITICEDLENVVTELCPDKTQAMIENIGDDRMVFDAAGEDMATKLSLEGKRVLLYTGTFEAYQGIDLLIEALPGVLAKKPDTVLVMVGGTAAQVEHYRQKSARLGLADAIRFTGTLHPSKIPDFFSIADVIVSPRSRGTNTPLKIYGYLRTGIPLVATNRHTHTQVLNGEIAELVAPDPQAMANGICRLLSDPEYATALATRAREFADEHFSDALYIDKVNQFYQVVLQKSNLRESCFRQPTV